MRPPEGPGGGARDLDAVISASAAVDVIISGISNPLQPRVGGRLGGGGVGVGAGCGSVPPPPPVKAGTC